MTNAISKSRVPARHDAHERNGGISANEVQSDGIMAEERRTQILQILRKAGRVKVNELATQFSTSDKSLSEDIQPKLRSSGCNLILA